MRHTDVPARLLAFAGVCALCTGAFAQRQGVERLLIHDDLRTEPVRLLSIAGPADRARITYLDADGIQRTLTSEGVLAITHRDDLAWTPQTRVRRSTPGRPASPQIVTLVTGERYVGELSLVEPNPDVVTLTHDALGLFSLSLETIAGVTFGLAPSDDRGQTPSDDVVVYSNGDRSEGFVVSVGGQVSIEIGGAAGGRVRRTPPESVRAVRLANPPEASSGTLVWLDDGSVVATSSFSMPTEERIAFEAARASQDPQTDASEGAPDAEDTGHRLDEFAAVVFDAERLTPLSRLESSGDPVIVSSASALLFASPIHLPTPRRTTWTLPPDASRFGGVALLPLGAERWGDFELVVGVENELGRERELERLKINTEHRRVELSVELPIGAEALTITIDPGAYGSIQDSVRLERAVVSIDPTRGDG